MLLLVGLGNPGARYAGNRHNIGFMAVDAIAEAPRHRAVAAALSRASPAKARSPASACCCCCPAPIMNESGRAVAEAAHFYKLAPADIMVFHDEIDLPPGKVRVKTGGGNAGHNGLRSISAHIGNDYRRVRIGVGHPGAKELVEHYVLSDFAKSERPWVEALCGIIADNVGCLFAARMRVFRTRCISPCTPRASATSRTRTSAPTRTTAKREPQ